MAKMARYLLALLALAVGHDGYALSSESSIATVLYLADVTSDGTCAPSGCLWRTYSPETGEDRLMLTVDEIPRNVFWKESFVYYRLGNRFFRAPWREESSPEELFGLPFEESIDSASVGNIWRDSETGTWKLTFLELDHSSYIATRWAREDGRWERVDSRPTRCECSGCPCLSIVDDSTTAAEGRSSLHTLVEQMRVEFRAREAGFRVDEASDGREYYFPSSAVADYGVRVRVDFGDTPHARAPLYRSRPGAGEKTAIFGEEEYCYPARQLGFEERGPFLLVASEYISGCGRVVDMRTGQVLKELGASARYAVWLDS